LHPYKLASLFVKGKRGITRICPAGNPLSIPALKDGAFRGFW
jgi:hypothetical protein